MEELDNFMEVYKRCYIDGARNAEGLVVVIDILRAFSTASYVLGNGADRIIAVRTIKQAFELKEKNPEYVLVGENWGIKIRGFDFGSSPTEIGSTDFTGKTIVHRTTSGTQGIVCAENASEIILGSFTTASAIERYIRRTEPEVVTLVCIGDTNKRRTVEDWAFAEYMEGRIKDGNRVPFSRIRRRISKSRSGSYYLGSTLPYLKTDFEYCMALDRFDFVMVAKRCGSQAVIKKIGS